MCESMIERVALALYNEYRRRSGMLPVDYIGANRTPACETCRADARAAIEAMREPTDAMVRANGTSTIAAGQQWLDEDARSTWRAMIDAALNEQVAG